MPRGALFRLAVSTFLISTLWQPASAGIVEPLMWQDAQPFDGTTQGRSLLRSMGSDVLAFRLRETADLAAIETRAGLLLDLNPADGMARVLLALVKAVGSETEVARALLEADVAGDALLPEVELAIARALIARQEGALAPAQASAERAIFLDETHPYAHNVLATIIYRKDGPEAALPHMERAARLAPDGATYWANYGATLAELGFLDRAQRALTRAVAINPVACDVLLGLGRLDLLRGQHGAAAQSFASCLQAQPENGAAARGLVVALIEAREFETARGALEAREALISDAPILRAEIALRAGATAAAEAAIAVMDAGDARFTALGRFALIQGDLEAALRAFEQADTLAARLGAVAARLAMGGAVPDGLAAEGPEQALFAAYGHLSQGAPDQALEALSKASYAVPGFEVDGLSVADLAKITEKSARDMAVPLFLRLSLTGGAGAQLRAVAEDHPDDVLAAFFAAEAAAREGLPSIDLLEQGAGVAPNFAVLQIMRGNHYFAARDARGAFEAYAAAAAVRKDPDVLVRLGLLGETLGEDEVAEAAYRAFLAVQPESYIALNQLAWFLAVRADDLSEATDLAQQALDLKPDNAAILDTLGWIALREGRIEVALERLGAAAEAADGGAPEIVLNLVEALIVAGEMDRARSTLAPIVSRVKDTPLAPRADALTARVSP